MLLRWDDQEAHVNDAGELASRLESLAKSGSAPVLVSLAGSVGTLSLGVGHRRGGLLLFADNDRSQPPLPTCIAREAEPSPAIGNTTELVT